MDMDIPMEEELEWLEANSHLHDDLSDIEPPEPYPEEEPKARLQHYEDQQEHTHQNHQQPNQRNSKPNLAIPAKPTPNLERSVSSKTQFNVKKRFRSDARDSLNPEDAPPSEEKRLRINDPGEEEWLRYSPSPREAPTAVESEAVEKEKIVSRYASEIDGDFIPVTGPGGDRVYAKISGVEKEDRLKKLDVKAYPDGMTTKSKFFSNILFG